MLEQQPENAPAPAAVEDARWKDMEARMKKMENHARCATDCCIKAMGFGAICLVFALLFFIAFDPSVIIHDMEEVDRLHDQMKDVRKYLIEEQLNPCQPGDEYCKWRRLGLIDGLTIQLTPVTSGWPFVISSDADEDDNDISTEPRHPSQIFATH